MVDNITRTLITLCLTILVVIFLLIAVPNVLLVWGCTRQLVILLAHLLKRTKLGKSASLQTSMIANLAPIYDNCFSFSIVLPVVLEGRPTLQKVRDTVRKHIVEKQDEDDGSLLYPELQQNITYFLGYPFWKKLPLKSSSEWVNQYVTTHDIAGKVITYPSLMQIVKDLSLKPYYRDRPLIEFIYIAQFDPHQDGVDDTSSHKESSYSVLILRLHHALADGKGFLQLIQDLNCSTPMSHFQVESVSDYTHKERLNQLSFPLRVLHVVKLAFKGIHELAEHFYDAFLYSSKGAVWVAIEKENNKKGSREKCQEPELRISPAEPFHMKELSRVKQSFNVSGTAVIFSAILSSVRKSMFASEDDLPERIAFGLPLPLPRKSSRLTNMAATTVFFPKFKEGSISSRLVEMNDNLLRSKTSALPLAATLLWANLGGQLPGWMTLILDFDRRSREMVVVSNLAGPSKPTDVCGHKVVDMFWVTGFTANRNHLLFSMLSYAGRVRITLMGGSHLLTSQEKADTLIDNFYGELELLNQECRQPS